MFFRKKKKEGKGAGAAPPAHPPGARSSGAAGAAAGASEQGEDGERRPDVHEAPSTQFLTGEARKDRRTVQVLLDTIASVSESKDLQSLLNDIVDRSIEITGAERGLLVLQGGAPDELEVRVARMRGAKSAPDDVRFSTSVAHKVLKEIQPVRATVHSESEALELGRSVYDLKLRAVMCVPLAPPIEAPDQTAPGGVLYVDSRAATRNFTQGDLALFAALAQHISIAMDNARLHLESIEKVRIEQSLELASAIQRDLMPQVPTDLAGWEVHGWYGPAEGTAGDFYDFIKLKDGKLVVVVGDVTGHGIGPALITATAQASLRSYLRLISEPAEVVTLLNQDLCERVEDGRFLTLYLAELMPDGGLLSLNGGHALPFLWRKEGGDIETIGRGGPALGMIPDEVYKGHQPMQMQVGDVLVIYTDGLTEARDLARPEELFGEDGAKQALMEAASAGQNAKEICLSLVEAAMRMSGNTREDDITVVVVRRTESSS